MVLQWHSVTGKFNQARRCGSRRRPRPQPSSRFSRSHSPTRTLSHSESPYRKLGTGFGPHRQVWAWPGVTTGIPGSTVHRGSGRHGLVGPGLGLRTVTNFTRPVVTLHWQCGTPAGRPGRGQARLRLSDGHRDGLRRAPGRPETGGLAGRSSLAPRFGTGLRPNSIRFRVTRRGPGKPGKAFRVTLCHLDSNFSASLPSYLQRRRPRPLAVKLCHRRRAEQQPA